MPERAIVRYLEVEEISESHAPRAQGTDHQTGDRFLIELIRVALKLDWEDIDAAGGRTMTKP